MLTDWNGDKEMSEDHWSFPPILQERAWTKAVPYKQLECHHTPSEAIGNNYSPSSQHLKISHLKTGVLEFPELVILRKKTARNIKTLPLSPDISLEETDCISRSTSPEEQHKIINGLWHVTVEATASEAKIYEHYCQRGIKQDMIEAPTDVQKQKLLKRLKKKLPREVFKLQMIKELFQEVDAGYYESLRKAIVDYVLLDPNERKRLGLKNVPQSHRMKVIRAPVPWRDPCNRARDFCQNFLFVTHPILVYLNQVWFQRFWNLRFIDVSQLIARAEPSSPDDLLELVSDNCRNTRRILETEWLVTCCQAFAQLKSSWEHLVPSKGYEPAEQVDALFRCVASFMSIRLRDIVEESLQDFVRFASEYDESFWKNSGSSQRPGLLGSAEEKFLKPLMNIELVAGDGSVDFRPSRNRSVVILVECIHRVLEAGRRIPRVEKLIFPEMKDKQLFLFAVGEDEDLVQKCIEDVARISDNNVPDPLSFVGSYAKFLELTTPEYETRLTKTLEGHLELTVLRQELEFLEKTKDEIFLLHPYAWHGLVCIDTGVINCFLCKHLETLQTKVMGMLKERQSDINRRICISFEEMCSRAGETPSSTAELVELSDYLRKCKNMIQYELKEDLRESSKLLLFLVDFTLLPAEDLVLNARVFQWPKNIRNVIANSESRIAMRQNQIEGELRKKIVEFEAKVEVCARELDAIRKRDPPVLVVDEMKSSVQMLKQLSALLDEATRELKAINEEERLLGEEISAFAVVQAMVSFKEPYETLWTTALHFTEKYDVWFHGPFRQLKAEEVSDEVDAIWKTMYKLSKTFAEHPVPRRLAENVKGRVERFKQHLPLLHVICNPGMTPRHWQLVSHVLGHEVAPAADASLSDMLDSGLKEFTKEMEEISVVATKEHSLENTLAKMKDEWREVHFDVLPYRDTGVHVLTSVDDIQLMLDDHILRVQTMRASPFIKPLETEVKLWEEQLILLQDILDAWLKCQSTWSYLNPIFGSEDIVKQMPAESRKFARVDQTWRELVASVLRDTRALVAISVPYMLQKFVENNRLLEEIQKGLNDYLDRKRLFFPRFYFLSNDELLEILSETKDHTCVEPHLKKCFEGIYGLRFGGDADDAITGMLSSNGECVPFHESIYPAASKGLVEKWLAQVEAAMIGNLKEGVKMALASSGSAQFSEWVARWPGQVVACSRCIRWTSEVTEALGKLQGQQLNEWYRGYLSRSTAQLEEVVALVRTPLEAATHVTVSSLLVLDVHARDVVTQLMERDVQDIDDFEWISRLRYYSDLDDCNDGSVQVRMVTANVEYGFEYLGNCQRLVVTPLTERCFRTLLGALQFHQGGAVEGPAGTGKTETVRDLAKAVAKQCIVFNCSEGLDVKAMGKFFKGLVQAGAWACFDEFNRIDAEVLSVVAQQIHCIQWAKLQGLAEFVFDDVPLRLDPSCAVFVTMNPAYGGRQDLPINLRVLFRSIAMMVPDQVTIAEICLFASGFSRARSLAPKLVHAYRLCAEQLSRQRHYDYGMRALKTVLVTAAHLRSTNPDEDEAVLLLTALKDANVPKLLADDVPLFESVLADLFPEVPVLGAGTEATSQLRSKLVEVLERKHLQPVPLFVDKILQVHDTMAVRHGVMLVGGSLSGKTTAYEALSEALSDLQGDDRKVSLKVLNPKALTPDQLYGGGGAGGEWRDGVLAVTFREFARAGVGLDDPKWIVLDGPIDPVWIEDLNTVLDDNRKLCLANGEIIPMSGSMRLIFESADLEHASPATVSRCGMVHFDASLLGWKVLKQSYVAQMPVERVQRRMVADMMDWIVPPALRFVAERCRPFVAANEMHLGATVLRLYDRLLRGVFGGGHQTVSSQLVTTWLQTLFLFAAVWGVAAALPNQCRVRFDAFLRNLLYGNDTNHLRPTTFRLSRLQMFPEKRLVFDYVYELKGNGQWVSWPEAVDRNLWKQLSSAQQVVATDESARQIYFLTHSLQHGVPLMLVGPRGTGKSSVTKAYLGCLPKSDIVINLVTFSARTSARQAQENVLSRLDRRRKGVFGPPLGRRCVVFIDDLSLPNMDRWRCRPAVELLRQWLDHGVMYDDKDASKVELVDTHLVAAMGLSSHDCQNDVSPRFLRHFFLMAIDAFEDASIARIYCALLDAHFARGYDAAIQQMSRVLVQATLSVYRTVLSTFLPTPSRSHYVFSLRDFSRVVVGVLQVPNTHLRTADKVCRLWTHEVCRVFGDRLVDDGDRKRFYAVVEDACQRELHQSPEELFAHLRNNDAAGSGNGGGGHYLQRLLFGDYLEPDRTVYDEVLEIRKMADVVEAYVRDHNALSPMPLEFFPFHYALEHLSHLCRVLRQDGGGRGSHAVLVGVTGSGRRTVARLAAFVADVELRRIEASSSYGATEWRDDLKKVLLKAGVDGKQLAFLLADDDIIDDCFLDDVNVVLSTGDIPNLFCAEEKAEILEKMQALTRDKGQPQEGSVSSLYDAFVARVRRNLHVVVTLSPIGDRFRRRLATFPALVHACNIDWFSDWPQETLATVAERHLSECHLGSPLKENCRATCIAFHESVLRLSDTYFQQTQRRTYVTPMSYLQLMRTFNKLLERRRRELAAQRRRYLVGLDKLRFAAEQVTAMQEELRTERPKLERTTAETERLMVLIERDTIAVEARKEIVAADEALANAAAAESQAIKDECENDLAEATPAMESAVAALDTLKQQDITVIKAMKNPPSGVKLVLEAICIMKGIRPERKPQPGGSGKMLEDYWGPSQKLLGDLKFLDSLRTYDKDNIPDSVTRVIRQKYLTNPDFEPSVMSSVSTACEGLCNWVCAIEVYDRVTRIVAPKKEKLAKASAELAAKMEKLDEKRAQLQEVTDRMQVLNDEFVRKTKEKKELEDRIRLCCLKLDRAEKLIGGLGGERSRWQRLAAELARRLDDVVGDALLAAAAVAYLGPFPAELRRDCGSGWRRLCRRHAVPCCATADDDDDAASLVVGVLADPVLVRRWSLCGLPLDGVSVENAVIAAHALQYPLMIDPQGQANRWIKNLEQEQGLEVSRSGDASSCVRSLKRCIQLGVPLLLEDVGEELDPVLFPVLLRQTYRKGAVTYVNVANEAIEYNDNFRLYLTTRARNPHFLPEVSAKVNVLNFTITPAGLEDQLLGRFVAVEEPDLEEQRNDLIVKSADNQRRLQEIEDKILEVLSTVEGNILEDETAISVLSSSQSLCEDIMAKQAASAETEVRIEATRNLYRPVAVRSSVLFFCICDLAHINPMYQFSLGWFLGLFMQSIKMSPKTTQVHQRTKQMVAHFTNSIFRKVCHSLFGNDKMVFAGMLCIRMLKAKKSVDENVWNFILRGGGGVSLHQTFENPCPDWITDAMWKEVSSASLVLPKFQELSQSVARNPLPWKRIHDCVQLHRERFPEPYDNLDDLERMVVLRCFRSDQLLPAMKEFVCHHLGPAYVDPLAFDLAECFSDSDCRTPLVFVLTPSSDPVADIVSLARSRGLRPDSGVRMLSLGQGQGEAAASLIEASARDGSWVVLQNCHLVPNWLPKLEAIWMEVTSPSHVATHLNFRLWLTSQPTTRFPSSLLEASVKMTDEPSRALRPNLMRLFRNASSIVDGNRERPQWQKLPFGLCFFHAVVQERQTFGPLGWNVQYEFNDADLRLSLMQMQTFLDDTEATKALPVRALRHLTGECNYGGRVTDEWDRRLLVTLVADVCDEAILAPGKFRLSAEHREYYVPQSTDMEQCLEYIESLPASTPPRVLGLHENASIARNREEACQLLSQLAVSEPGPASLVISGALVPDLVDGILKKLPQDFSMSEVKERFPIIYGQSMNAVLHQEVARYSQLLSTMRQSLEDVRLALKGRMVLNDELEDVVHSLVAQSVPAAWLAASYPSQRTLSGFVSGLQARLVFIQDWIDHGPPDVFWIPGFFICPGFLTGVLQNYARKHHVPIDQLYLKCDFLDPRDVIRIPPEDGAYIRGLYLEGARWDMDKRILVESLPNVLHDPLPTIWLRPCPAPPATSGERFYSCPVYNDSSRSGDGNFLFSISIPTELPERHWTKMGVACICQPDD